MIPTLLELGPIKLHSYGLCLALALIVGHYLMMAELKRRGMPESFAGITITLAAIFGVIGARLFDILEHPEAFRADPIGTMISGAGLTWYGGFLLGALAVYIASRVKKLSWWAVIETSTPGLALGYGFGRLGCLLSGDGCYGNACAAELPFPLCMSFPKGIVPTIEVVYNTPLWEIGGAIATFAFIWSIRRKVKRPPMLFLIFLVVHGVLRFFVEFVRRNPVLGLGLSQAQWISVGMVAVGLGGLAYMAWRRTQPAPAIAVAASGPAASGAAPDPGPAGERPRGGKKRRRRR